MSKSHFIPCLKFQNSPPNLCHQESVSNHGGFVTFSQKAVKSCTLTIVSPSDDSWGLCCDISSSNRKFYRRRKNRLLNCRDKGQTKISLVSELSESWVNITPNTKLCGVVRDNMFYQDGNKYKEIKWSEYTPKGKTSVGAILGKEINILN